MIRRGWMRRSTVKLWYEHGGRYYGKRAHERARKKSVKTHEERSWREES
jgi:hypothetical protein